MSGNAQIAGGIVMKVRKNVIIVGLQGETLCNVVAIFLENASRLKLALKNGLM